MPATDISTAHPLPVAVVDSPSATIPAEFIENARFRLYNIVSQSAMNLEVLKVEGAWILCTISLYNDAKTPPAWLAPISLSGYTWEKIA